MVRLGLVVEGHGEVSALPVLIRRIAHDHWQRYDVQPLRPIRLPRTKFDIEAELRRAVALAATGADAVLVVLDSDDDCPAEIGPSLLARALPFARGRPVAVVAAHREFETWFLASLESLSMSARIIDGAAFAGDVEQPRDAKGILRHLTPTRTYSETVDQGKLSSLVDVEVARSRSPSFDKLCRDLDRLTSTPPCVGS